MNEANAPHWTLYRRTANMRNHPRTLPMRTTPTWLISIGFPRRRDAIRSRGDKGTGPVLSRNNYERFGKPAARLNYLGLRFTARRVRLSASQACPVCGAVTEPTNA